MSALEILYSIKHEESDEFIIFTEENILKVIELGRLYGLIEGYRECSNNILDYAEEIDNTQTQINSIIFRSNNDRRN